MRAWAVVGTKARPSLELAVSPGQFTELLCPHSTHPLSKRMSLRCRAKPEGLREALTNTDPPQIRAAPFYKLGFQIRLYF